MTESVQVKADLHSKPIFDSFSFNSGFSPFFMLLRLDSNDSMIEFVSSKDFSARKVAIVDLP